MEWIIIVYISQLWINTIFESSWVFNWFCFFHNIVKRYCETINLFSVLLIQYRYRLKFVSNVQYNYDHSFSTLKKKKFVHHLCNPERLTFWNSKYHRIKISNSKPPTATLSLFPLLLQIVSPDRNVLHFRDSLFRGKGHSLPVGSPSHK